MISYRNVLAILVVSLLLLSSCSGDVWRSPPQRENKSSRFVLMQGQRQLPNGQHIPIVLRMDSTSGEAWVLGGGNTAKWEPIHDDLMPTYKKDLKTNKWELGVKLPDGRHINELSKEELIRIVQSRRKVSRS
jgi:hypothetical protein